MRRGDQRGYAALSVAHIAAARASSAASATWMSGTRMPGTPREERAGGCRAARGGARRECRGCGGRVLAWQARRASELSVSHTHELVCAPHEAFARSAALLARARMASRAPARPLLLLPPLLLLLLLARTARAQVWPLLCPVSGSGYSAFNETRCPATATCCANAFSAGGGQGCCPYAGAVCCPSGFQCCPAGSTCTPAGGSSYGEVYTCTGAPPAALRSKCPCKPGAPLPSSTTR